jgi:general secretion pathway protein A
MIAQRGSPELCMYETFYGFSEKPFALTPDPRFIYFSDMHRTAYSLLEYSLLNQAGFVVISGDIGAGKTTLLTLLMHNLPANVEVGAITNTHAAFGTLIQLACDAFNIIDDAASDAVLFRRFGRMLAERSAAGNKCVLIVDEAQNLSIEQLEQLRLLSNTNSVGNLTLQIILVGQPELADTLRSPRLEQFAQRISAEYHLRCFDMETGVAYIDHRLTCAGGDAQLFSLGAKQLAAYYGRGTPRLINNLCDLALVCGYAAQSRVIDRDILKQVIQTRSSNGIMPMPRLQPEKALSSHS